ncbi:uncharacterized protein [Hyperolius riggenbachi]|uniref:uncharacterized protein n=1 Tax=Hyperolius riggenbachi TaxID=752182 RepID=UPI0035A399AB
MIYRNVQLPINPPVATMSVSMVNPPAQYLQNSPSHFLECFLSSYDPPVEDKFYTMFHGTSYRAAKKIIKYGFKQSESGMLGRGIYVSRNIQKAKNYPRNASTDQIILKLRVNVGRVKKIDMKGHALQYNWHSHHGYDTAWVPPNCGMVDSGMEEDCVWDPKRIKVLSVAYVLQLHALPGTNSLCSGYKRPVQSQSYTMYHGTTYEAAVNIIKDGFKQSTTGMLGRGIYLSRDKEKAQKYPLHSPLDKVVLKVSVRVGKVKKIDFQGHALQYTWHDHGYDTAWVPPNCGMVDSGMEEDCVWDPKRIKVLEVVYGAPHHQANLNHWIRRNCT